MDYYRDLSKWKDDYPIEALIMIELDTLPEDEWEARLVELGWIELQEGDDFKIIKDQANPLWHMHAQSIDIAIGDLIEQGVVEPYGVNEDGEVVYRRIGEDDGGA